MENLKKALKLFLIFFKIGLTTFGGGYAMISIFEEEFVSKRGYLTQNQMLEMVAIAESTPGPIAVNSATYIGYKKAGILGSVFATIGVVLPSFIIIFLISLFFNEFMALTLVQKAFKGIQCGVGVLITLAGIKMFKRLGKTKYNVISCLLVTVIMILFSILAINFSALYVVLIGGALGLIITGATTIKNYRKKSTKTDDLNVKNTGENIENGGERV
ncbi:MAG: chromate transporter [Clostridia bacterium]|nr:chromate transporter [Clostridia bacterium]